MIVHLHDSLFFVSNVKDLIMIHNGLFSSLIRCIKAYPDGIFIQFSTNDIIQKLCFTHY